jgi:hypothetical protein
MRDKWTLLIAGGCLGSVVGVIGASITDPGVGFPAWVDLTGVVVGFGLGVLTTGLVALFATRCGRRGGSISERMCTRRNCGRVYEQGRRRCWR